MSKGKKWRGGQEVVAGSEIYRVEIPIIVNDQTEAPFRKAEERVSKFQRNAEKSNRMVRERMLSLAKLQVEPVMKVRDQLTNGVLKADKLIKRLGTEKASPLIEAQDRVSAVVTRINAALKALDKGDIKVLAEMKGPLMDEIVKAKSSLAALNNVKSGPVAELRGELFGQLSKGMSQLRDMDMLHVEPKATLRERVTWKAREIGSGLRRLTSKTWTVVIRAKDKASGVIRGVMGGVRKVVGVLASPLTLLGLGGGIGGLTKAGIDLVTERQNITMAFETMLGSAKAATKRVEELTKFAGQTPFSRDDIYESSRVLEVFTKGALSTSKGLKLVGDVAAGTKQPYKEVALWTGRLYDAMAAGRPVGMMTSRLQEMGAISGEGRAKLEDLADSGKKISQTWPEAEKVFARFNGQMEKMSHGLGNMLLSTKSFFRENVIMRWGKGVESTLKPLLTKFRIWRNEHPEAVQQVGDAVERIAKRGTEKVVEFCERAYTRIQNIIESPEFKNAEFGEKVRMLVAAGLDDAITWLQGPGKDALVTAFTTLGEAAAKAYVEAMKTLGKKSIEELKKGNLSGAAIPAAAMWMLGGGALLKGGIGAGKGIWNAGKWAKGKLPLRTATAGGAAAETAGLSKGFNIKQLLRGWFGPASPPINKQNILARPEPGYKPAGKRFWENIDLSKVENRDKIVSLHNTGKLGRYKELEKAFGKLPGGGTPAKSMVSSIMGKLGDVKSGNWAPLKYIGKFGKVGSFLSRWSVPLALGTGAAEVALSRPENRLQTGLNVGGRLAGGAAGATLGAKAGAGIGTFFGPGIGNLVGGAVGGLGGGIAGAIGGEALVKKISGWVDKIDFGALADKVAQAGAWISEKWTAAGKWISSTWSNIIEFLQDTWSSVADWFGSYIGRPIKNAFINTINFIVGLLAPVVGWINTNVVQPIVSAVGVAAQWISDRFSEAKQWVCDRWSDIADWFNENVCQPIAYAVGFTAGWISEKFDIVKQWIIEKWSPIAAWFNENVWMPIQNAVQVAAQFIGNRISEAKQWITSTWAGVSSWFSGVVWEPIKSGATAVASWISDRFSEAKQFVMSIYNWIEDKYKKISSWAKGVTERGETITGLHPDRNAYGDIITHPTLSWIGEAGPEAIIPLSTQMRGRAINLYERVGRMLGVKPYAFGGLIGSIPTMVPAMAGIPAYVGTASISSSPEYSPVNITNHITINTTGSADPDEIAGAIATKMESIFHNMPRK